MPSDKFGGRYISTGTTHSGGTGSVYVCHDPNLERRVAIKFLGPYKDKKHMFAEIGALQKVRSKNVVEIFDVVIEAGNNIGLVQEYLDGQGLHEVKVGAATDLLRLLYQAASAIADVHGVGIIHRDVKPKNMRLTSEGILKLFDFDLSRFAEASETVGFKGTHGYAAPELYAYPAKFDKSVDVFALAASFAQVSFGDLPGAFYPVPASPKPPDLSSWIKAGGFLGAPVKLPESISVLLHKALGVVPSDRPSAMQIRDEAARYLVMGKHRLLLVSAQNSWRCDQSEPTLNIESKGRGKFAIKYDGLSFFLTNLAGAVEVNAVPVAGTVRLPASCVVGLGVGPAYDRVFLTLDTSHPGVVL